MLLATLFTMFYCQSCYSCCVLCDLLWCDRCSDKITIKELHVIAVAVTVFEIVVAIYIALRRQPPLAPLPANADSCNDEDEEEATTGSPNVHVDRHAFGCVDVVAQDFLKALGRFLAITIRDVELGFDWRVWV